MESMVKARNVHGITFEPSVTLVVKPKSPMQPVYRKTIPVKDFPLEERIRQQAGDRYFVQKG